MFKQELSKDKEEQRIDVVIDVVMNVVVFVFLNVMESVLLYTTPICSR